MTTRIFRTLLLSAIAALALLPSLAHAQAAPPLDPTRNLVVPPESTHQPLPEQYIWTRGGLAVGQAEVQPRFFRAAFNLTTVPPDATLYLAGPRSAKIYLNGKLVDQFDSDLTAPGLDFRVFATPLTGLRAAGALRAGRNVIALEVVRGKGGSKSTTVPSTIQIANGKVIVAKILPAAPWVLTDSPALLLSDTAWKATLAASGGWQSPAFDDSAWPAVASLGPIELDINLRQWNTDAGMYNWPGYQGVSSFLRQTPLPAVAVTHVFSGRSTIANADALTKPGSAPFTVRLASPMLPQQEAPSLVLDFGRETVGRLQIVSTSAQPATVAIEYGESENELLTIPTSARICSHCPPTQQPMGPSRPSATLACVSSPRRGRSRSAPSSSTPSSIPSPTAAASSPPIRCSIKSGRPVPTPRISACRTISGTRLSAIADAGPAISTSLAALSTTSSPTASSWKTR